jgi:hypothetical protein
MNWKDLGMKVLPPPHIFLDGLRKATNKVKIAGVPAGISNQALPGQKYTLLSVMNIIYASERL